MNNKKKRLKKALFIGKFILGISLLAIFFLWNDNIQATIDIFKNFRLEYLIALLSIAMILNLISCLKWNLFLKERGIKMSVLRLLSLYLIGRFFNNFMPSTIGGDLTRSYLLGRHINSQSKSMASIFLERFTGMIALIMLAIIFSLINVTILREPLIGISIIFMTIICVVVIILIFNPSIIDKISKGTTMIPLVSRFSEKLMVLYKDIIFFKRRYNLIAIAMMYSFIFHLLTSVNVYVTCLSIGFHPYFLDIAVITPIILLVTTIPVSPNNIGWWEWAFGVFLVGVGAGMAQGLAVALTLRGISLLTSAIGGVLFLIQKNETSSELSSA
jgi:uncharacterized protein (TIRG00374 family)